MFLKILKNGKKIILVECESPGKPEVFFNTVFPIRLITLLYTDTRESPNTISIYLYKNCKQCEDKLSVLTG